ncbi:hypothetical protein [Lysinibacillus alkalisoli]|uniref:hypothetical protein n=1 Tax=Lysinibacillus alkalisoli TaxID=1911548 RepID=UPI001662F996|nr:hypothetical protein [Lysinibacillus alkalisoli]
MYYFWQMVIVSLDLIVLIEEAEDVLYLLDVVSHERFIIQLAKDTITKVQFFFMPRIKGIETKVLSHDEGVLCIAKGVKLLP